MADKSQVLRLTWRNQAGRTYAITINNPVDDITHEDIEAFGQMVVNKNIIKSSGGDLTQFLDAKMTEATVYDLYTPA